MVVNTTDADFIKLLTKNGIPKTVCFLPGGKNRFTFGNIYQAVETIRENRISSVILVTSSYHLPRALFILGGYLKISGKDVRIQGFPAEEHQGSNENVKQYSIEVLKLWGSVAEVIGCYVTGQRAFDAPSLRKLHMILKKNFLI